MQMEQNHLDVNSGNREVEESLALNNSSITQSKTKPTEIHPKKEDLISELHSLQKKATTTTISMTDVFQQLQDLTQRLFKRIREIENICKKDEEIQVLKAEAAVNRTAFYADIDTRLRAIADTAAAESGGSGGWGHFGGRSIVDGGKDVSFLGENPEEEGRGSGDWFETACDDEEVELLRAGIKFGGTPNAISY